MAYAQRLQQIAAQIRRVSNREMNMLKNKHCQVTALNIVDYVETPLCLSLYNHLYTFYSLANTRPHERF
jgi:hypothetical protein